MSLKQDVIIVNEYSVPLPGGRGSRGGTPGSYVERYMAREQATESLAPVQRLRTDDFIMRYMARESAVERGTTRHGVKREFKQAQGEGGVAFGYGTVSLSDEQLKNASADIQNHFEAGHTVLKTVLSFDEDYLKKHGIVDADFHCENRGDYRGHLDQMKLRMAIMQGLDRMAAGSGGFDDLRYVGVIQVDTEHVHCHLAMVDGGHGQLAKDGTQRGKLLDRHRSRLRRGIDAWLDEKQAVAHLSSAVGYERRNVTTFIKRWAHERMSAEALPQFLTACLPADRKLWRAGTNDHRMRKANQLVTELVEEQLERSGSPMPEAMERILDYANTRHETEGLSTEEWQRLVDAGRSQVIERAVNGVYQMLRALPADELRVRTPLLDVMSMDYEQMAVLAVGQHETADDQAAAEDVVSFGFKLRSYASRLEHHRKQTKNYRHRVREWEKADQAGAAAEDSRPLYDFYRFEEEYQRQLMAKYQHFLPFVGDAGAWYEEQKQVADYGQRLLSLTSLRGDASLQRMKDSDEAERVGREIYGQSGGRLLTQGKGGREVLDYRIATMRANYDEQLEQLRDDLALSGLVLRPAQSGSEVVADDDETVPAGSADTDVIDEGVDLVIEQGVGHDFDEVKALDLHHLGYDFFSDVEIGTSAQKSFAQNARRRRTLLMGAINYLEHSGQSDAIADLPVDDVASMTRFSRRLSSERKETGTATLPSRFAELRARQAEAERVRRQAASTLDAGLVVRVQGEVDHAATEFVSHPELIAVTSADVSPETAEMDRERE